MVTPLQAVNKVTQASSETKGQVTGAGNDPMGRSAKWKAEILAAVAAALESAEAEALLGQLNSPGGGLDEREQSLLGLRNLMGRAMAQACLTQERGYSGAWKVCQCGRRARYVRDDPKRYVTVVGEVELWRAQYWCPECGAWRPLDEQWDLPQGHFTRAVVRLVATMGGALPFERAAEVLEEVSGIGISATQVRRLSEQVGAEIGRQQAVETAAVLSGEMVVSERAAVLVVGLDGAHVNTREGGWKETKIAVAAACEWQQGNDGTWELRPRAVDYTALVGPPEPFGRNAYALAQRLGGRGQECTIAVGDGAPWIWNQVSEHFPDAVQVLDFYHLAEHVHGAAKVGFADDEAKARDWAETVLELLRESEMETALEYLRRSGEWVQDLIGYITANEKRMPYRWLREHGYPIGSGIVESACKQIVHARHRQAGMRWRQEHVQKMLNLACCVRGQRWDDFWAGRPKVA